VKHEARSTKRSVECEGATCKTTRDALSLSESIQQLRQSQKNWAGFCDSRIALRNPRFSVEAVANRFNAAHTPLCRDRSNPEI